MRDPYALIRELIFKCKGKSKEEATKIVLDAFKEAYGIYLPDLFVPYEELVHYIVEGREDEAYDFLEKYLYDYLIRKYEEELRLKEEEERQLRAMVKELIDKRFMSPEKVLEKLTKALSEYDKLREEVKRLRKEVEKYKRMYEEAKKKKVPVVEVKKKVEEEEKKSKEREEAIKNLKLAIKTSTTEKLLQYYKNPSAFKEAFKKYIDIVGVEGAMRILEEELRIRGAYPTKTLPPVVVRKPKKVRREVIEEIKKEVLKELRKEEKKEELRFLYPLITSIRVPEELLYKNIAELFDERDLRMLLLVPGSNDRMTLYEYIANLYRVAKQKLTSKLVIDTAKAIIEDLLLKYIE